ncbi:unnamed protein product [Chrysoparadoxa australica]
MGDAVMCRPGRIDAILSAHTTTKDSGRNPQFSFGSTLGDKRRTNSESEPFHLTPVTESESLSQSQSQSQDPLAGAYGRTGQGRSGSGRLQRSLSNPAAATAQLKERGKGRAPASSVSMFEAHYSKECHNKIMGAIEGLQNKVTTVVAAVAQLQEQPQQRADKLAQQLSEVMNAQGVLTSTVTQARQETRDRFNRLEMFIRQDVADKLEAKFNELKGLMHSGVPSMQHQHQHQHHQPRQQPLQGRTPMHDSSYHPSEAGGNSEAHNHCSSDYSFFDPVPTPGEKLLPKERVDRAPGQMQKQKQLDGTGHGTGVSNNSTNKSSAGSGRRWSNTADEEEKLMAEPEDVEEWGLFETPTSAPASAGGLQGVYDKGMKVHCGGTRQQLEASRKRESSMRVRDSALKRSRLGPRGKVNP